MSRIVKAVLGVVVVLGVAVGTEGATPSIIVGTHYLLPDTAGQTIEIYVTGGDVVQGLNFYVCIGGNTVRPTFGDVDILDGTIFDGNNTGHWASSFTDYRNAGRYTTTASGEVFADGLLATLTIDTTDEGLYDLSLTIPASVYGGSALETDFAGIDAIIMDGSIVVVPEPTSMMIILAGSGLLIRRRRNKNRH